MPSQYVAFGKIDDMIAEYGAKENALTALAPGNFRVCEINICDVPDVPTEEECKPWWQE